MRLSVASNFDDKLITEIKDYPVSELYGKLTSDIVGGGRSSYMIDPIGKKRVEEHVAFAAKHGIGFNYLFNAACLDNIETTRSFQKQIRKLLDWICEMGVRSTTVSNPLLLRLIKKKYPELQARVSVFACVDHLQKAMYWQDLGADVICLDSLTVNREFESLKSLRSKLSCDLQLLANNNCLQSCSIAHTHMCLLAHSSQSGHKNKGFVIDHCILECTKMKMQDPVNFIRSDWIRPEDLHYYEEIGIDNFKLVERNLPTELMVQRVKAYSERSFDGNFIELIQPYGHQKKEGESKKMSGKFWRTFSFLFHPFKVNPIKLLPLQKLSEKKGMLRSLEGPAPIVIDNKKLDGFLTRFLKNSCRNISCEECQYCHQFAEKAITINKEYQNECLDLHKTIDKNLETGGFWNYTS